MHQNVKTRGRAREDFLVHILRGMDGWAIVIDGGFNKATVKRLERYLDIGQPLAMVTRHVLVLSES